MLQHGDGSEFTIEKSELYANYANILGNPEAEILEKQTKIIKIILDILN